MIPNEVREALDEILWAYYDNSKFDPDFDRNTYGIVSEWRDSLSQAPEPDWSKAPEWAEWWAVNADGGVAWFENKPTIWVSVVYCGWESNKGRWKTILDRLELPLGVDWRTTLRKRPA